MPQPNEKIKLTKAELSDFYEITDDTTKKEEKSVLEPHEQEYEDKYLKDWEDSPEEEL